jgi:hypothetical protein
MTSAFRSVIECPFVGDQGRTAGLFGQPITPKSDSHLVVVASDPVGNASLGDARKDDYYPAPAEAWGHSVEVQGVGGMVPLVSRGFTEMAVRDESQMQAALALQPEWYEGQVQLAEAYEGNGELGLALQAFQCGAALRTIDWATATVMVSTVAGVAGSGGHVDGKGAAAKFSSPDQGLVKDDTMRYSRSADLVRCRGLSQAAATRRRVRRTLRIDRSIDR